jgi:hypothetical protein
MQCFHSTLVCRRTQQIGILGADELGAASVVGQQPLSIENAARACPLARAATETDPAPFDASTPAMNADASPLFELVEEANHWARVQNRLIVRHRHG